MNERRKKLNKTLKSIYIIKKRKYFWSIPIDLTFDGTLKFLRHANGADITAVQNFCHRKRIDLGYHNDCLLKYVCKWRHTLHNFMRWWLVMQNMVTSYAEHKIMKNYESGIL